MKAEAERIEKALPGVDQKEIEKAALKSIDISSLFIKKVQSELSSSGPGDKKSAEYQAAEDAAKKLNDKYNLAETPKIITDEQKKTAAHKSQQSLQQTSTSAKSDQAKKV